MAPHWPCPPLWRGQTAFLVGAGPSLRGFDFNRLREARVVVLKSMWALVPGADYMLFTDEGWRPKLADKPTAFRGQVVTVSDGELPCGLKMRRGDLRGLASEPDTLNGWHTVAHFGLNLIKHLSPGRVGLLGIDLALGNDGATHCHAAHQINPTSFAKQQRDLATTVEPLRAANIEVLNCTPGGRLSLWPRAQVGDLL